MLCLGIDPDLHDLAITSWDDLGPVAAHVVHVPRVKGRVENEAVLAMMIELSKPWPSLQREQAAEDLIELPDFCAVEAQELSRARNAQHRRPQDIVTLGQVAGMALMRVARGYLHGCGLYFPKPSEWKGSVEKHAMQARLYDELGWGYEIIWKNQNAPLGRSRKGDYAIPKGNPGGGFAETCSRQEQWKHVGDALLLARWCWEQSTGRKWTR